MRPSAEEDALRQELAAALKTARKKAGLLQRELGHKMGYSRSRIAGAEAGDYVSRQFCERCDAVLGTTLSHTYAAIRALRTQRLLVALAADTDDTRPAEPVIAREISGSAEIRGPEPESGDLRVRARLIGGFWHIAIRLPCGEHGTGGSHRHVTGSEGTATAGKRPRSAPVTPPSGRGPAPDRALRGRTAGGQAGRGHQAAWRASRKAWRTRHGAGPRQCPRSWTS